MFNVQSAQCQSKLLSFCNLRKASPAIKRMTLTQRVSSLTLVSVLGLTGGWLGMETIAPSSVQAYTGQTNIAIDVQPGETYNALVRRAEAIARAATQRSFDRDILVTEVSVIVVAQNAAAVVPILAVEATRAQWRGRPDPRRWATYYGSSKGLLGLDRTPATTATTPAPVISAPSAIPSPPAPVNAPIPGRPVPTNAPAGSPGTPASAPNSGAPNSSDGLAPTPGLPGQILPDRIPTPAGIGK